MFRFQSILPRTNKQVQIGGHNSRPVLLLRDLSSQTLL